MAINIPIITEFVGTGIDKAIKEFKQLEGAGAKAGFAIKKAAVPAAAALAGLGAAAFASAKGAMEDAAAQEELARTLSIVAEATDDELAANEKFISSLSVATATADDELRPALAQLARGTEDLEKAQGGLQLALDISKSTGKDLGTVSEALSKAYAGNMKGLQALDPRMKAMIKDGASLDDVMNLLGGTFGGAAATAADTAQGQFKRLGIVLEETKESIGAALIPIIEKALPLLTQFGNWASENTTLFLTIAGAIGGIAAAVVTVNAAMKVYTAITTAVTAVTAIFNAVLALNPIILIAAGIAIAIAALVVLQMKFNIFGKYFEFLGNVVGVFFDGLKAGFAGVVTAVTGYVNTLVAIYKGAFNGIADIWNKTVGKLSFKIPSWVPGIGGAGFSVPDIPKLADGGIVTGPTLALIGEAGPEAVVPLTGRNAGNMGGNVTINVNGGDPNAVVSALRTYMRQNGSIPIKVGNAY